jgi:two-component system, NtrC family, sensor kinase
MEAFAWSPLFFTGIESVDAQHHRLVDITNALGDVTLGGSEISEGRLQILFKELTDYAREHFQDEEALMRQCRLDPRHVDAHVRHHHQFVEQLLSMWRARGAMKHPAETIHDFLSAWLAFHILGEDQVMARQMARVKEGESPAIAYELEFQQQDNSSAALLKALHTLYHLLAVQNRELAEANERLRAAVEPQDPRGA